MKTLYQKEAVDEIINRVNKLFPSTQHQWGKMNADQMLAHCSIGLETAIGTKYFPQLLFGKLMPTEWSSLQYKHLDHHLAQFGA
jgi:hypothetical protein